MPAGFAATFDLDGGRDRSAVTTLTAGQDRDDVDFGEREEADLTVLKVHDGGPFGPGDQVTFTITVRNLGAGVARSVATNDRMPAGLTAVSASGTGWTCTVGATVGCTLAADLAAGATAPAITLVASVDAAITSSTLTNTATVSTSTPDPVPSNDRADDRVELYRLDLTIAKELVGDLVAGQTATYRLTVTNKGPVQAISGDVRVVDALPEQLTATSATGVGLSCSVTDREVACVTTTPMGIGESRVVEIADALSCRARHSPRSPTRRPSRAS